MEISENLYYKVRCCSALTLVQLGVRGMHERSGGSLFASTKNYTGRVWSLLLEDVYTQDVNLDRCEQEAELCRIILEALLKQLRSDGDAPWPAQSPAYQRVMAALYSPLSVVENPFRAYCEYFQKMSLELEPWLEHPERDMVVNALMVLVKHVLFAMQRKLELSKIPYRPFRAGVVGTQPLPVAELVPVCPCCHQLMQRNGRAWRCPTCESFTPDTFIGGIAL